MAPPPGILEVRCAGCGETLEVEHGLTEFACPDCGMPQALPPELMPPRPRRALPLPRRGAPSATAAAPVCVACGGCGAVLSVPHGVGRFGCPRCGAELAASPAAAISVVAPPAAVPITSNRPPKPSEVQGGPSSQPARAGKVQKRIHSEQTHGQHPKYSFRDESFSSFRADTRTQIPVVGRLQNEPANSSVHREESHTELLDVTIAKPGKKKSGFAVGPKSCQAGKVHEEHPNQVIHASQAQGMPSNSSVHTDQAEGRFPDDTNTMHNKQKTGHVAAPSVIKHEQINSSLHEQLAGEFPSDVIHSGQVQVHFACKAMGNNEKSAKDNKGNKKRKNKSLMNSSNERSHLRRSKRLAKGSPVLIDTEPIQKLDASPNQNHSEAPQIERTIADPGPSSPTRNRCPQAGSNELDNVDATTPPTLNHGTLQTEQFPHCYSQMYSPETRCALPNPSSNSWHEHETHQESFDGIDQLDRRDEEVHSNPSENQNKHIDGQVAQEACTSKNHPEQVWLNPHSNYIAKKGRQQKNHFIGSSSNGADHPGDWSFSGTHHQINMAASCRHSAALLPVPIASTLPTITSPSSLEKLPLNCINPTALHHQPQPPLYSQDARCGDMLSGSVSESSKKRRGRAPAVLMEPRKEVDRPVLTPNGTDNWNVHPPCPKLATTLSLLIKQNYPGTYVSVDTNGKPCELVVYHWHQCPSDVKATVLDEFLKRYKWPPGHEEECQKIFDRKAVRQLVNLFCYEKQTVREELAAKKAKRSSAVGRASGEMAFEEEDGREDSEEQQRDESLVVLEHDDPLKWKPFVPEWMQPKWWEMLCDHWAKDEVMKVSYQKRKNRNAGNHPCNAAGYRSIATHQQLMSMDNGRKLVSDFDPSTKIHSGKGQHLGKKALRTENTTYGHTEETRDTQLGPHPVKEQVGSWKRGRYYGAPSVSKKAQIDSLPKSSPGCFSKQGQQPMFTQEQVQQMISQALQGLNETWEKKFLYLEQNMRSMSSSRSVPVGAKGSLVAVAGDKQCQLSRQDTLDSVDGERDPAARDEGDNQDTA